MRAVSSFVVTVPSDAEGGCWPPPRRPRRRAGQRLGVAGVVGEAHPHLDRRALVGRHQRVGARRRPGDVRLGAVVHPDPLVRVADAGQPVGIHDAGGVRRQRLPDLRRARDRRRARRKGVGRRAHRDVESPLTDPPLPSLAVTFTDTVPTSAVCGVPEKVRVVAAKPSHVGSAAPSASVAV